MRFGFGGHDGRQGLRAMADSRARGDTRQDEPSDAFVFFGATGDLAFKQIFPALVGLIRDEGFDLPIIGVARSGDLDSLRDARPRRASRTHGFDGCGRRPRPSPTGCAT